MGRLEGKVTVVVGAATGIGATVARMMAAEGAKVAVADLNGDGAEAVVASIRDAGGEARSYMLDVADEVAVEEMVQDVIGAWGRIDALSNNAAAQGPDTIFRDTPGVAEIPLEVWDRTMAVNLRGMMLCCRFVIPHMIRQGGGSIINTGSVAGLVPEAIRGAYAVSKAGVVMLSRHIATAYGKNFIRCNTVCPGVINSRPDRTVPEWRELVRRHNLIPRDGRPEDIASMVVFLASDESTFITAQTIAIDGGMAMHHPAYADMTPESFDKMVSAPVQ